MSHESDGPIATRLAERFRSPILLVGWAAGLTGAYDRFTSQVPTLIVRQSAIAVAVLAVVFFLCAVCDKRFHRAISALNAKKRAEMQARGGRRFGWLKDRMLNATVVFLMLVSFAAMTPRDAPHHHAVALTFAAACLVMGANIALETAQAGTRGRDE